VLTSDSAATSDEQSARIMGDGCDTAALNNTALEAQLWEKVKRAYAASRHYRAGDDPEYAKALAEFDRVANPQPASNVIPFRKARGQSS
jgi:hypothetical protein